MLLAGDELAAPSAATTTPTARTTSCRGSTGKATATTTQLAEFTRRLIALRRAHPALRRRDFFQGRPLRGRDVKDIVWLKPDGTEMTDEEWDQHFARCLGVRLSGAGLTETDERGRPLADDDFLVLFNAHHDPIPFTLPALDQGAWRAVLDTGDETGFVAPAHHSPGTRYPLAWRSVALLQHQRPRR